MYVEWIRRARQGGLRLMVAHAVHNRLLADLNWSSRAKDDPTVARDQLVAIRDMVNNHSDFMEIALTPRQARAIILSGKLAVVLGIEEDNLFEGPEGHRDDPNAIRENLEWFHDRLGVRHVFPVHLADNQYGGFGMYNNLWVYNSYWLNQETYPVAISPASAGITDPLEWHFEAQGLLQVGAFFLARAAFKPAPSTYPAGANINGRGLQPTGEFLLRELMRKGMIIVTDHMGILTRRSALDILERQGYPAISGHCGFTELSLTSSETSDSGKLAHEADNLPGIVSRLAAMGGMVAPIAIAKDVKPYGQVANDMPGSVKSWIQSYLYAIDHFGRRNVALGTDFGLVHGASPRFGMKATLPLADDPRRQFQRAGYLRAQENGVRYAEPIRDTREHRFRGPNEGVIYDGEQKECWEAIALYRSGADPDGDIDPGPRTGRIKHLCRRLRATSEAALAAALQNLPPLPGDAPHEIRAGYYVRNNLTPRIGDDVRVGELHAKLLAIWNRWLAMDGNNRPLHRCRMQCLLHADPNHPWEKEWDINLDGMAHYGLLPDFLQDARNCGLDRDELAPLFRSAEDYIRLWERCERNRYTGP